MDMNKKETNANIAVASIFAMVIIFAILSINACTHEQSNDSNTIDTTAVRVDTVVKDTTK